MMTEAMIQSELIDVLRILSLRFDDHDLRWAVVGSLGLALRGAPVRPRDIDIMTDKVGAYHIEQIFSDSIVSPISLKSGDMIRSHFGQLSIDGVKVEIMGDFQIRLKDGRWQDPPDLQMLTEFEMIDDMSIPVLSLEWEADSYSKLGRVDRAESAKALMIRRASDGDLRLE